AFVGFVTWAGASVQWWVLAVASAVATLVSNAVPWAGVAAAGFVLATIIGLRSLSLPVGRAIVAGLTMNALMRWDPELFHGATALVTGAVAVVIVWSGLARRGRMARRTVRRVLLGFGAVGGLAVLGAAAGVAEAYSSMREGEREVRDAVEALQDGDVDAASEALRSSAVHLEDASVGFDRPWARPARAVPFVGQHVQAVADLAAEARELATTASTSVAQVNVDSLRVVNGVIDLTAIEVLQTPFGETASALRQMAGGLDRARSPWLVPPLGDRVDELAEEIDELVGQTDKALAAVELAPPLLGADGPRTYFVAFTTPAEARGLGGFMGTWAELRADGGQVEVVRTGQTSDLSGAMRPDRPVLEAPDTYLARYGRFGAGEDGAAVSVDFWSNVTMPPDLPTVADVVAQLYPASGGTEIDGVIVLDVYAIARFLDLTGPLSVEAPDGMIRLTASNAVEYLLRDQYEEIDDDDIRDAVLEEITSELIEDVFGGDLPGPRVLAQTLGPAMAEGRLAVWSLHDDDQDLLRAAGISGELPAPAVDGLAVVTNNGGANKLDAYLRRSILYEGVVDEPSGALRTTVTVRLANDAPDDLPPDAGGNPFGLPPGTNRSYLSIYSPWEFDLAELDGVPGGMEVEQELGWTVYSRFVEIPPGGEIELRLGFSGTVPEGTPYELLLRSQALTYPDVARVDVRTTDGEILVESHGTRFGVQWLS
ncbi:MAG: DUF4012 domain-containing protein, partial [Actinomycetota bacterium]|nr:DUF4012 domain-containing protein [Actinomycetota bacterium]